MGCVHHTWKNGGYYCTWRGKEISYTCNYDDGTCRGYDDEYGSNDDVTYKSTKYYCPNYVNGSCSEGGPAGPSCWDFKDCYYYKKGSGGGCYLTTACVNHKGLPDDCYELETLRHYRDTYLKTFDGGRKDVQDYYRVAPGMVAAINKRPDKDDILEHIYSDLVLPMVNLVENKKYAEAHYFYRDYVAKLENLLKS